MSARSLWTRIATGVAAATITLIAVPVPAPGPERADMIAAAAGGVAAGALLFMALARVSPRLPTRASATGAQLSFLVVWAWVEEVLWRRLLLGGLTVVAGAAFGLVAATALFALAHRQGRGTQVVTGTTFGAAYLATGRLIAAVASHAAYNVLVAGSRGRTRWRPT